MSPHLHRLPATPPARAARIAAGLALVTAATFGVWDSLRVVLSTRASFAGAREAASYLLASVLSPLLAAVLMGPALGLLAWSLSCIAISLAQSTAPSRTRPWLGSLSALICLPYVVWVSAQLFRGPRASQIPGHNLLAVLLGLSVLLLIAAVVPRLLLLLRWVDCSGPRRPPRARALATLCLLAALCCSLIDQRVLPRLYGWFHLSLFLLTTTLFLLFAVFLCLNRGVLRRIWLHDHWFARGALLLAAILGTIGVLRLVRLPGGRARALEHSAVAGRMLGVSALWTPRRPPPPALAGIDEDDPAPPGPGPRLPGVDVYLITVDALRADRLDDAHMPVTAALARRGVRFRDAYTQAPHTSFAVATLHTGKPIYALMNLGQEVSEHETLALVLRQVRYKTAAFYPPSVFFIEHERLKKLEEMAYGFEYVKYEYLDGERRTDQVLAFFAAEHPARAFVWIHYLEPHEPYDPHPGGPGPAASDRDRYDGEVRYVDQQIGRIVAHIQQRGRPALVILAADHGEEFGEHGGRYHGTTLYEEQVRIPLFFTLLPGAADAGVLGDGAAAPVLPPAVIDGPVGLIDVAPSLLWLLDVVPSLRMRGRDLGPWMSGSPPLPRWPVFADIGRKKMVVQGDDKLICDLSQDSCALYNLRQDPGEQRDLYDRDPALVQRGRALRGLLERYLTEASRFEFSVKLPGTAAADDDARRALLRGRLQDRGAIPELLRLAARSDEASLPIRREAVSLLAQLCVATPVAAPNTKMDDAVRPVLPVLRQALASTDPATRAWSAVGLVRLGDDAALEPLAVILRDDKADAALRGAAALALAARLPLPARSVDAVALLVAALPGAIALDDPERVRPLLLALGRARDARAVAALIQQIDNVRSRVDVVVALGLSGDRHALAPLIQLLEADPYVPVRAAAAAALASIGGPAAHAALLSAAHSEHEPLVKTAIDQALR